MVATLDFAWPLAALGFPAIYLIIRLARHSPWQTPPLQVPPSSFWADASTRSASSTSARHWYTALLWLLLVVALMRPQLVGHPISTPLEGRNIFLVLDLSKSMAETDVTWPGANRQVSRLTALKRAISSLLDRHPYERYGLVVFGTDAFLLSPLTYDTKALDAQIASLEPSLAGDGTAIGVAISFTLQKLHDQSPGSVLILATDGRSNSERVPTRTAVQWAKERGLRIYTIGFGANNQFDRQRRAPDYDALKQIADATDGMAFKASSGAELSAVYAEIAKLESFATDRVPPLIPKRELFYYPLIAAALLVLCLPLQLLWQSILGYGSSQTNRASNA